MKKMQELLVRSFDQVLSAKEQQELDQALEQSKELRQEKEQLESMRNLFSAGAEESFRPMFAERVMNRITTESAQQPASEMEFFDSLLHIFRKVAIAGAIAIVVLASAQLIVNNPSTTTTATQNVSEMSLDDVLVSAFISSMEDML